MQRRGTQAFPGGVHPTDGSDKALSMDQAVKPYRPDIVTILSEQTFGGTCQFTVTPGESVIEGQLIGKPEAFLAAPLHASISGTVLDVKEVEQLGRKITACIIQRESDHCQVSHTTPLFRTILLPNALKEKALIIKPRFPISDPFPGKRFFRGFATAD